MLKQVTVNINVDDHEPEKCGNCPYKEEVICWCTLFDVHFVTLFNRCKQCLEEAK